MTEKNTEKKCTNETLIIFNLNQHINNLTLYISQLDKIIQSFINKVKVTELSDTIELVFVGKNVEFTRDYKLIKILDARNDYKYKVNTMFINIEAGKNIIKHLNDYDDSPQKKKKIILIKKDLDCNINLSDTYMLHNGFHIYNNEKKYFVQVDYDIDVNVQDLNGGKTRKRQRKKKTRSSMKKGSKKSKKHRRKSYRNRRR